jgi:hypothetical protein
LGAAPAKSWAADGTEADEPTSQTRDALDPSGELSDVEAPDIADPGDYDARLKPHNPAYEDGTLIARVGDDRITAGDLYYALDFARGMNRQLPPDTLRAMLIEKAVNQKLLTQEARQLGYERNAAYVNAMSREEDRLVTRELVRRIYTGKLTVTEDELRELYERYFYTLRALHLSVGEEAQAQSLRKRIEAGENFGDLARLYSEDTKTAPKGGDMGEIRAGRLVVNLEDAVFALEPGQLSPVIKSRGEHYKIFQLLSKDRDREPPQAYEEMRPALAKRVRTRKAALSKYAWEQGLLTKYELTIDEPNYRVFSHRLRDQIASWEAINSMRRDSLTTAWIFTDWPADELVLPIATWKGGQMTCAEFNKVSRELRVCPTCLWRDSDVQLRMFVLGRAFDRLFELEKRSIRLEQLPEITTELERRREARLGEMVAAGLLVRQGDITDEEARAVHEESPRARPADRGRNREPGRRNSESTPRRGRLRGARQTLFEGRDHQLEWRADRLVHAWNHVWNGGRGIETPGGRAHPALPLRPRVGSGEGDREGARHSHELRGSQDSDPGANRHPAHRGADPSQDRRVARGHAHRDRRSRTRAAQLPFLSSTRPPRI